ncbi:uroporphyrinogen-III C-methyltransferase [Staphylococcus sp. Marseille-Q1834]|uniref:uroporphyrinogen-III C-methyltransferase n=1 Tax=Staphylococcus sp. Marseille-Q1834 TaxID=2866594 RepID=UPI0012BA34FE|nr:uroporphyrinogen-III C-methyltransferase [Staphylococcus sp. Marseille-Q1834]
MSLNAEPKVYLIGAGPGNPNLLTKKAERILRKADVILYDRLVNPLIIQYASPSTEVIDVGKKPYAKHIQQEEINLKIVEATKRHRIVVRLKGGDPAIFGRVTEEIDTLKAHGISYEIVPGVTSASAAVANMEIGLTMRSIAPSVTFSTGYFKDSINRETDIRNLINGGTLAIYMGIKRLNHIIRQITVYTNEDYSIAIVFNATCYNQKVIIGKLSTIEAQLQQLNLESEPGICILGAMVEYIDKDKVEQSEAQHDETLYIINGSKDEALLTAEDLSEKGKHCLLAYDDSYHKSQQWLYQSIIDKHHFKFIETTY